MRKFLIDQVTPELKAPTLPVNSVSNSTDKFIIVESNFRVFAYTDDQKYIAILKLFLETSKEIHNPQGSNQGSIFLGQITKSKIEDAFK